MGKFMSFAPAVPKHRVLLADDNLICLEVAACLLESLGCHVDCAANGREAVERAESDRYDAIFLDIIMPEMNGIDAARIIHEHRPDVPIIAVTASISEWTRQACDQAGMSAFVPKPISRSDLAVILDCLEPAHASAGVPPAKFAAPSTRQARYRECR